MKKYVVDLSKDESHQLKQLTKKGATGARKLRRAQILLSANKGKADKEIAQILATSVSTVQRVRRRFVEEGLQAALSERPRIGGALQRKLDGHQEATCLRLPQAIRPAKPVSSAGACRCWPRSS